MKDPITTPDRFDNRLVGQSPAELVLKPDERRALIRPYRDIYVHVRCGTKTRLGRAVAETVAADPNFYVQMFCWRCQEKAPVREFVWDGTSELVGS